jgi:hypothetical protein
MHTCCEILISFPWLWLTTLETSEKPKLLTFIPQCTHIGPNNVAWVQLVISHNVCLEITLIQTRILIDSSWYPVLHTPPLGTHILEIVPELVAVKFDRSRLDIIVAITSFSRTNPPFLASHDLISPSLRESQTTP